MVPAAGAEPKFGPIADRNKSVPRLGFAGDGTLWMLVRHHPLPGGRARSGSARPWRSTARPGRARGGWPARPTSSTTARPSRAVGDDLLAVYSSDLRQNANTRIEDDLYAARLVRLDGRDDHSEARRRPARARRVARHGPPGGGGRYPEDPRLSGQRRRQVPAAPPRGVPPAHRGQLAQRPGRADRGRLALRPRRRPPRLDGQRRPRQRIRLRIHVVADPEDRRPAPEPAPVRRRPDL